MLKIFSRDKQDKYDESSTQMVVFTLFKICLRYPSSLALVQVARPVLTIYLLVIRYAFAQ